MDSENSENNNLSAQTMEIDTLSSVSALQALSNLLHLEEEDDFDPHQVHCSSTIGDMGPGNIGPPKAEESQDILTASGDESENIWNMEEIPEGAEHDDIWDIRETPEYEIIFQQKVGTEDVYLGLTEKDPSTASCQELAVKIKLPDTNASDIEVDIQDMIIDLRTPTKKLIVHLPQAVDCDSAKAVYDQEAGILEVTVVLQKEFDFAHLL